MEYTSKNRRFFRFRKNERPSAFKDVPFAGAMGGGPSTKWRRRLKIAVRWTVIVGGFGLLAGVLFGAVLFAWVSYDLPDPNRLANREIQKTTKIWDRTGEHLLYEIHGTEKRTLIELNQVSDAAVKAAISSEDRNFYKHHGFQLQSFVRAGWNALVRGKRLEGTSTITQQLIKNVILSDERSLTRKAKELILSYQVEKKFSKDQILKMYFNEIPYGSNAYGIESAAQMYFGKNAKDLDAAEGAMLAALVRAPSRYSPYGSNTESLLWWQHFILDVMAEDGYLSKEEAETAKSADILARVKPRRDTIEAPHFSLYVKELLAERYGERTTESGGLNVITTLDYEKQKFAEEAVTNGMEGVRKYGGTNAALLAMDPKTSQVLAMVGSADYFSKEIDGNVDVTRRNRQPGSSFKPIAYAAAFEKGYTPNTVVFDVETDFPTDSGNYHPRNYDLSEHGPITLRRALAGSLNIPAVKTLYLTGIGNTLDLAEAMGYSTLSDRSRFGLSLVLGGAEVKLIDHVAAFSVFAQEGVRRPTALILKVEDANGRVLEEWKDEDHKEVLSIQTARNINSILSDNAARAYVFGERNFLTLPGRQVAAKTGTTNNFVDAWTVGYTPNLAAGVWTGKNDNTEMKRGADGSRIAAPIWNEFMRRSLEGLANESFTAPEPIVTGKPVLDGQAGEIVVKIDKFSGNLATAETPPSAVIEKTFHQAHDILYYIDKDDPRGPYPADAQQDPHYLAWERAVASWAARNGWADEEIPTEPDTIHDDAFKPTVAFELPADGAAIASRTFVVRARAQAPRGVSRVEYTLDGALIGTAASYPWEATVTIPAIFGRGFYTLRATAYDDIEHSASQDISVNLQTDGQPLSVEWLRPAGDQTFRIRNFPMYIDASLSEFRGVKAVTIRAVPTDGEGIVIGTLMRPGTAGVSVSWSDPPAEGAYRLEAVAELSTGTSQTFPGPKITLRP